MNTPVRRIALFTVTMTLLGACSGTEAPATAPGADIVFGGVTGTPGYNAATRILKDRKN